MNNSIQLFNFQNSSIRVVSDNPNAPEFVAVDVAKVLGYAKPLLAVKQFCKGAVKYSILKTAGGKQKLRTILEPDLYRLIFGSKLESAIAFQDWVFDEVLPSIRKTGSYTVPKTATPEQKQHIKSLVIKRVNESGASYSTMWNVVFDAAGFNKLENLTPASYERACAFFKVETLTGEWEHVRTPRLNIPTNDGRYLLVIRGNQTTVIDATNHNLIEAVHARKIQQDMGTMRLALQDLSHRMQLLHGDVNEDVVAQPLEIAMN